MSGEERDNEIQRRQILSRLRSAWGYLVWPPSWIFAPEGELLPEPPDPSSQNLNVENASYEKLFDQRKAFHDETSKTVRRVFYTLLGTCLFCIITLVGTPDSQLLTPQATVTLPILSYQIGFQAFLLVGPVVLIALTVYLHIFVGQLRLLVIAPENRQPMLPNFNTWTAKLVVLIIFYWMVPFTLGVLLGRDGSFLTDHSLVSYPSWLLEG